MTELISFLLYADRLAILGIEENEISAEGQSGEDDQAGFGAEGGLVFIML